MSSILIPKGAIGLIGESTVSNILDTVRNLPIIKKEDMNFLVENSEHLGKVMECTHMWRTDLQKLSIINDIEFPTIHSKFHQSILEQKVQFDNSMYLAKEYEDLKLDMQLIECDIEDLEIQNSILMEQTPTNSTEIEIKRNNIKIHKKTLELAFKKYNLKQMRIAMDYRMQEVKGWKTIQNDLLDEMRKNGLTEEEIWSKSSQELKGSFFHAMNKLQSLQSKNISTAEYNNLIAYAVHVYTQAKSIGKLYEFKTEATPVQINSIEFIENLINKKK